jgi:hypothetical protein
VLVDGSTLASTPRYFGYGAAFSIAGSAYRVAIATASGTILYFDARTKTLEGTIPFQSSHLEMSSDGTVLAAAANREDFQYHPDRTLNVYSLPAATVIRNWPSQSMFNMTLSASGLVVGQTSLGVGVFSRQVMPVSGGPVIWSETDSSIGGLDFLSVQLSPDGSLIAAPENPLDARAVTNVFRNGTLVTAVPGFALGWLDDSRLLVKRWQNNTNPVYAASFIHDVGGAVVGSPTLPDLRYIQRVDADSFYSRDKNTIYFASTGAVRWSSPNGVLAGAVAGPYVVFARDHTVRAEPY